jgi:pre-mRNA cleavage complex 2 protein Pcf11
VNSNVKSKEWIKSHDDAEDIMTLETETTAIENATATAESKSEEVRKQYVVVPDASETHKVCPICQEELKYVWHDETDEFVWMDAKQVGGRIYHASCHAEASKDRANGALAGGSRGGTPDSAAGVKRKAEVSSLSFYGT